MGGNTSQSILLPSQAAGNRARRGVVWGNEEENRSLPPTLPLHSCSAPPEIFTSPICEAPVGEGQSSWPHSTISTSKPDFSGSFPAHHHLSHGRQGCIQILPSDNIVPCGPSASICCDFSQARQQPKKNPPRITLKPGSWKKRVMSYCSTVPHNPWCFHKLLDNIGG